MINIAWMNRIGAGEGITNKPSAREKIEALLADKKITTSLPKRVGSFIFKQESDPDKREPSKVVLREGYNDDPTVVLVVLLDFMSAAITSNVNEEYLEGLFRLTGLKPERAKLRFDINTGDIILIGTSDQTKLEAEAAGEAFDGV